MHASMLFGFILSLLAMVGIGLASSKQSTNTSHDYLLASRSVPAWLTALSAVSTTCSGFMFIGLIGMTYYKGISGFWVALGLVLGQWLAWRSFPRFREKSEAIGARTIPDYVAKFSTGDSPLVKKIVALLTLTFLGTYAAAQLNAGSKALHVLFSWDYSVGALLGSSLVLLYSLAGGIRASIWTDAAQSLVMLGAMLLLAGVSVWTIGGPAQLLAELSAIDPKLASMNPTSWYHTLGFIMSWFAIGIGVLGQPHVMVRPMIVESTESLKSTQRLFFLYYSIFIVLTVLVGLCCRVLIPAVEQFDSELALPLIAQDYLPGFFAGLILAGIFAATMSTADSQIISCSASLSHDLCNHHQTSPKFNKLSTCLITAVTLMIALFANESVFVLVLFSWCALASGIGPILFIQTMSWPLSPRTALVMIVTGITVAFSWRYFGLQTVVSEALPGMMIPLLLYAIIEGPLFNIMRNRIPSTKYKPPLNPMPSIEIQYDKAKSSR